MKRLYIMLLVLVLALAMMVPAGVAVADSPQIEVSGAVDFVFDPSGFVVHRTVGEKGVLICSLAHFVYYTGDLEGEAYETHDGMVNMNTGVFNSGGLQVFTGTLGDKSGTFTARTGHHGVGVESEVVQTIISGTGDFAGLHGTFHFTIDDLDGDGIYTGTYSGKLHFAQ